MGQMAMQIGGAVVGGVIGFFAGGQALPGAMLGASIGGVLGGLAGSLLFPVKSPSNLPDLSFSSSSWGELMPVLYGTGRIPGKLIWCGPMNDVKPGSKGKGGGKSGGKKGNSNTPEHISVSFAMLFCQGPGVSVNRIWGDGNLFYDRVNPGAVANNPFAQITVYDGGESQLPNPEMAQWIAANVPLSPLAAPAFRGSCYIVFHDLNITPFGNRIPNITAELTRAPIPHIPALDVTTVSGGLNKGLTVSGPDSLGANFDGAVDFATQRQFTSQDGAAGGVRVVDIVTNQEIAQKSIPWAHALSVPQQANYVYVITADSDTDNKDFLVKLDANSLIQVAGGNITDELWNGGPNMSSFSLGVLAETSFGATGAADYILVCGCGGFPGPGEAGGFFCLCDSGCNPVAWTNGGGLDIPSGSRFSPFGGGPHAIACVGAQTSAAANFIIVSQFGDIGSDTAFTVVSATTSISVDIFGKHVNADVGCNVTAIVGGLPQTEQVVFDHTDETLIIFFVDDTIRKFTMDGQQLWSVSGTLATFSALMLNKSILTSGVLGFQTGNNSYVLISTVDGHTIQTGGVTDGSISGTGQNIFDSISSSIIQSGGSTDFLRIYLGKGASNTFSLADIISDVCDRADLTVGQYDTTEISDQLTGYVITRQSTGKGVFQQLAQAFFFDVIESDYKLKFIPRGQAAAATFIQDDLADQNQQGGGMNSDYWVHTRAQQQDIPTQVNIKFIDQNNAYQASVGYAKRTESPIPTIRGHNKITVDIPVVMALTDGNNMAATWLWTLWQQRDTYTTGVGWQYLALDPADNVTVNLDNGNSYTVRMLSAELGGDYNIKMAFVGEDMDTYTPPTGLVANQSAVTAGYAAYVGQPLLYGYVATAATVTAGQASAIGQPVPEGSVGAVPMPGAVGAGDTTTPPTQTIPGPQFARLLFMPLPLLQDADDTSGAATRVYYSIGPYAPGWLGGMIFNSGDSETYSDWALVTDKVTWGTAIDALPAPRSLFATDRINTITLLLTNQTTALTTLSDLDFLNNKNMCVLGNEVINFQNVAVNADRTVTLSVLMRGCRGTEWACDQHAPGDLFVFLDSNDYVSTPQPLASIGVLQYFKLVGAASALDRTVPITATFSGYDLKPYAPVHQARAVSGSDLVVTWERRTRVGGALQPVTGTVQIGEFSELYDLYILAAPYDPVAAGWVAPVSFVRSALGLTSPTYTYTAAHMATDSFTPATQTLHIVVFQKSAAVGVGWPGAADLCPF